eukprot:gene35161-58064_t
MFPGDSDPDNVGTNWANPGFEWTQAEPCPTCSQQAPTDQRALASSHPFTLAPGDTARLVLGLITTFAPDTSADGRVALNRSQNKLLKQWYNNGDLPCVMSPAPLSDKEVAPVASLKVYPNPSSDVISISGASIQAGMGYELVDIHGRKLRVGNSQQQSIINIAVDDLASGIYFVRLQANGQTQI